MPYAFLYDKNKRFILKDLKKDRRIKLYDEDKENIKKLYKQGMSIRGIARLYNYVSRRLIQFVLFPERCERCKKTNYTYNKERHTQAVRKYRRYKYKVFKTLPKNIEKIDNSKNKA